MLPKRNRIHTEAEITTAMRRGRKFSSPIATVFFQPNALEYSRFGFLVSKKVSNSSVVRNRVKRRLRAACAKLLLHSPPQDFVIAAKPAIASLKFSTINREIAGLIDKTHTISVRLLHKPIQ